MDDFETAIRDIKREMTSLSQDVEECVAAIKRLGGSVYPEKLFDDDIPETEAAPELDARAEDQAGGSAAAES